LLNLAKFPFLAITGKMLTNDYHNLGYWTAAVSYWVLGLATLVIFRVAGNWDRKYAFALGEFLYCFWIASYIPATYHEFTNSLADSFFLRPENTIILIYICAAIGGIGFSFLWAGLTRNLTQQTEFFGRQNITFTSNLFSVAAGYVAGALLI
jgi:hypothetical protein